MLVIQNWIDITKLNLDCLSKNPNAIDVLNKIKNKNWCILSKNQNAIKLTT